jgi:thiamine transport system ATP-binding protein
VWRRPADPDTALFLGYARVLRGVAAARLLRAARLAPAAAVAVRRSALSVAADGPLEGVVTSGRATPDQVRLVVEVAEVGELDAVAQLDAHPGPGEVVHLAVDASRLAVLPDPEGSLD